MKVIVTSNKIAEGVICNQCKQRINYYWNNKLKLCLDCIRKNQGDKFMEVD